MMKNKRYVWHLNDTTAAFLPEKSPCSVMKVNLMRVSFSRFLLLSCLFTMTMIVLEASAQSGNPAGTLSRGNTTFFAYVDDDENLDVSFTRVAGQNADATITVEGPGIGPLTCSMPAGSAATCEWTDLDGTGPGIWAITQEVTTFTTAFDWEIDVQTGTTSIDGRVYTEQYSMRQLGSEAPTDFSFWYQSEQGFLYQADYTGYHGINSVFVADAAGVAQLDTCVSAYESMDGIGPDSDTDRLWAPALDSPDECGGRYKIFFGEPDPALPASATRWDGTTDWLLPPVAVPDLANLAFTPDSPMVRSGEFTFDVTDFSGQLDVQVDANGDGDYGDPEDVTIPAAVAADGTVTVPWDGQDGVGDPVPATRDINAQVVISRAGEIHFTNNDVETRAGLEVQALNGPSSGSSTIYWNDANLEETGRIGTTPSPLDGTGGVNSTDGAHGWVCTDLVECNANDGETGGWGDARTIDDWTFHSIDESEEIAIAGDPLPTFQCESNAPGLLFQSDTAGEVTVNPVDLVTGNYQTPLFIDDYGINATGYNVLDNYVYGWDTTDEQLLQVGSNGEVNELGQPTGFPDDIFIGDVDDNGVYWVYAGDTWYSVDVATMTTNTGTAATPAGYGQGLDWAFIPDTNTLWRIVTNTTTNEASLIGFNRTSEDWTTPIALPNMTSGNYGAVYASPDGFLYASHNDSGEIWRIDVNAGEAVFFANGQAASGNDGARCADSPVLIDLGDAPDGYGTTLADDGPRHGIPGYDSDTAPLMLGSSIDTETDGQPGPDADGDGDDEDGVPGPIVITQGEQTTVTVSVTNNTDEIATLAGWIDQNQSPPNGAFGNGAEREFITIPANSGIQDYELTFPEPTAFGNTYARFRLFPGELDPADILPTGPASAGEVEDYPAMIISSLTQWQCESNAPGLLFQAPNEDPTLVQHIEMVTGQDETAATIAGRDINAVAYNVLDDYVYGWDISSEQLVRIGADGNVDELGAPAGLPTGGGTPTDYNMGEIDENGQYWVTRSNSDTWYRVDLDPGSPTYFEVVESDVVHGGGVNTFGRGADWAYVPGGGDYLYRVMEDSDNNRSVLLGLNRSTGDFEFFGGLGDLGDNGFGAVYADADGFLYASSNGTGEIYRIDVTAVTGTFFASGPASNRNDGTRCHRSPILTDYGDAPDSYGTLLADDGPRHGIPGYDETNNTAPLMLGDENTIDPETDGFPGDDSDGDDTDGAADESAVADPIVLVQGQPTTVSVVVTNNTGETATLAGWIDLNGDGDFEDGGELQTAAIPDTPGTDTYSLEFDPAMFSGGNTYARFRLFPGELDQADILPTGPASAGEVEDYLVSNNEFTITLTGGECFRLLSSPVDGLTYQTMLQDIWTQGAANSNQDAGDPNVWSWDVGTQDWAPVLDLDAVISPGQGFLVSVFADDDYDGTDDPFPRTLTLPAGAEHSAPLAAPVGSADADEWILLGNPFQSNINTVELTANASELEDAYYVYDRNTDQWRSTAGGGFGELTDAAVAAGQGFFVQASGGSPSLEFTDAAKTTGGEFYGKQPEKRDYLRLEMQGEEVSNALWIRFSQAGSEERTRGDALKLEPLSEQYALLGARKGDGTLMDIAHYPLGEESLEIPVSAEATEPGTYTLSASELDAPAGMDLYLYDRQTGESTLIEEEFTYSFTINQSAKIPEPATGEVVGCSAVPQRAKTSGSDRFVISSSPGVPSSELPEEVALGQNYPNPFNPSTVISYQLPAVSQVRLEVYDLTGRLVATLVDGQVAAGTHQVTFDAGNLSSGVYLYRLQTGNQIITKKLTLIK